jgi:colanic acid biosynthesis glycosyl transferase WcaI
VARLIFINRFYWPDEPATAQLLTDLAEALAGRGHAVTVIASRPPGAARAETRQGVRILRVGPGRRPGQGIGAKALNFSAFFAAAIWRLARDARRGDVVVALTDPPLIGVGAALVARGRGTRLFHWVQDIYPEIAITLSHHGWLRALRPLRDTAWRRADGCVTLGRDMAAAIAGTGVPAGRIHIVPNWAPAGVGPAEAGRVAALREAWGLAGTFVIAYAGNLGRVHDLGPVLEAAEILRAEPGMVFAFIGDGAGRAALEAEARRRGLAQVHFLPSQPRAQLATVLSAGDVHLVSLRADCAGLVFPSKLYGIAAVGRPVVFVGPPACEPARLVTEQGLGWAFASGEMPALAARLRALRAAPAELAQAGAAATQFAARMGGAAAAAAAWDRLAGSAGPK